MVRSAEEAKRIIQAFNNTVDPMEIERFNAMESKGYLSCLVGPEVKALVEAALLMLDGYGDDDNHVPLKKAIAAYMEAIKK